MIKESPLCASEFLNPWNKDTISASGVEVDTHPCFLDCAARGKCDFGPFMHKYDPDVDLLDIEHPPRSASANMCKSKSSTSSAIKPISP